MFLRIEYHFQYIVKVISNWLLHNNDCNIKIVMLLNRTAHLYVTQK
jgi:hypothetical protein